MNQNEIFDKALSKWGFDLQADVLIEEMSELTKAIIKARRNGDKITPEVVEEMVDVSICLMQIRREAAKKGYDFMPITDEKLKRLEARLS